MKKEELKEYLKKEENKFEFIGWDFSYLNNRMIEHLPSWNYKEIILEYLRKDDKLLDMGTGGGEFLLSLNHPYPNTTVTESYKPNIDLCNEKLRPLGIDVYGITEGKSLPFCDESFDIVINRHADYDVKELHRILKKDGIFITQQVGGDNNRKLSNLLINDFKPLYKDHNLDHNIEIFKQYGFEIMEAKEEYLPIYFLDMGALVYFAKIIEWEFPNFSVESCFDNLVKANEMIKQNGRIESTEHRFLMVLRKK